MRERHLESLLEDAAVGREGCEDGGEGGADVGAESQRVHAVEVQDADADERSEGRGEDRAALDQHREAGSDEDSDVAGEMAEDAGEVGVDEVAQDESDLAAQQRVQQLDNEHETRAQQHERHHQQHDAEHVVTPRVGDVLEQEVTYDRTALL